MKPGQLKSLEERAATRRELERIRRLAAESPAVKAWVERLRPTNCPGCGRPVFTPEGKAMACKRCVRPAEVVEEPSIPMAGQLRERRRGAR